MSKFLNIGVLSLMIIISFTACNEEIPDLYPSDQIKGAYIINYGNFGNGGSTISKYNYETNEITNNYYYTQNNGFELLSNIQFAYEYNDSIYLLTNNNDQIITVNPLFKQTVNGISSSNLAKPRYCVAYGNYLYISCWGENPDWSEMPDTYISKFNITTNEVEQTFPIPGGPEGMVVANDKLYVALNYKDSIAVLNLSTNVTTYIATPAVSSYLLKDNNNNLYATQISTWTDFSTETGLALINTSTDQYVKTFPLEGVSSEYGSIISANNDFSEIFVLATQYDENWNITGAVFKFDVITGTYTEFISGISGPKGVSVNPKDDKVYLFTSESVTEGGMLKIYSSDGVKEHEFVTGIYPFMALFLE